MKVRNRRVCTILTIIMFYSCQDKADANQKFPANDSKDEKVINAVRKTGNGRLVLLDIIGDNKMDSLWVIEDNGTTCISLIKNNEYDNFINILPLIDKQLKTNYPAIENVTLEANAIHTDDKGLRIVIRNTDMKPDYFFIDLSIKEPKILVSCGVFTTVDTVSAVKYDVNAPLKLYLNRATNKFNFYQVVSDLRSRD